MVCGSIRYEVWLIQGTGIYRFKERGLGVKYWYISEHFK